MRWTTPKGGALADVTTRGKVRKASVDYRKATDTTRTCGNCSMFTARYFECSLVAGVINPDSVCDRWTGKP